MILSQLLYCLKRNPGWPALSVKHVLWYRNIQSMESEEFTLNLTGYPTYPLCVSQPLNVFRMIYVGPPAAGATETPVRNERNVLL